MGFRYRGRSKGKDGWINWSWSKKNGLGLSASAKVGPFTWNSGNGKSTKKRITTNLPGGFYHVTSNESSRSNKSTGGSSAGGMGFLLVIILVFVWILAAIAYAYPWWVVGASLVGWIIYKVRSKRLKENNSADV